jgi:predicted HTH domain antitoxin
MSKLLVEIPEDVADALRLPPAEQQRELRKELALALYQRGVLALGKSRRLAEMNRREFDQLLGERKVARHYTDEDLRDDIDYGNRR